ncbi:MAG TPA: hypothetical protein PKL83_03100 [bacterium]|nr:hypothetical protein [bacterium]
MFKHITMTHVSIALILGLFVGAGIGYGIRSLTSASQSDSNADSPLMRYDSPVVVQRNMALKGDVREVGDGFVILVPINASEAEQDQGKIRVEVDGQTKIYLQVIDAAKGGAQDPKKVELQELQAGDRVDLIITVTVEGELQTTSISARRDV